MSQRRHLLGFSNGVHQEAEVFHGQGLQDLYASSDRSSHERHAWVDGVGHYVIESGTRDKRALPRTSLFSDSNTRARDDEDAMTGFVVKR